MQVEDDTSPSKKGRKAHIRVVSRGAQQQASALFTKTEPHRKDLKLQKTKVAKEHVSTNDTCPFLCLSLALNQQGTCLDG